MEKTVSLSNEQIQLYFKTASAILDEENQFGISDKLNALLKALQVSDNAEVKKQQELLQKAGYESYFNGASDSEMKVFSKMKAGRFFSDSSVEIINSLVKLNAQDNGKATQMLTAYIADRVKFLVQLKNSRDNLFSKASIGG